MTGLAACLTGGMRLSEFRRLMAEEFGSARATMLADHQALTALGSVSAAQALERGDDPARVWAAMCEEMQVPGVRRLGRDRPLRGRSAD